MTRRSILIVDDDPGARFAVREFMELQGYATDEAENCLEAVDRFRAHRPDIVILDYRLPDGNALELLPRLRAIDPDTPLIILTGHGTIDLAVTAIKEGAEQFLTKPVQLPALHVLIQRSLENQRARRRQSAASRGQGVDPFAGVTRAIRDLEDQARRVLDTDSPILIQGETGTGKGVLARWLHENGPRGQEAFVDLNCAGLSREFLETELFGHERGAFTGAVSSKQGLLEVADRGTVFLDEIGDIDRDLQPKLLKVLEEKRFRRLGDVRDRRVDIRLLAATHQDLGRAVQEGRFRGDLFYRVNTIPLLVPPLRHRAEDIAILSRQILDAFSRDLGRGPFDLDPEAVDALKSYAWPGNIRELRNVLERAILLSGGGRLSRADLRFASSSASESTGLDSSLTLLELEKRLVEQVLREESGKVEMAARRLGIPRSSLYNKLKRFNINLSKI